MKNGKWNLQTENYQFIKIYQIKLTINESIDIDKFRLLVLSHSLSLKQIPSVFSENSFLIFPNTTEKYCVICFDIYNNFNNINLNELFLIDNFIWDFSINNFNFIINLFQYSLTNYYFYKFINYSPIYFSNFLYFEFFENISNQILFKPIPILNNKSLIIRIFIQENIYLESNYFNIPNINSFLLISPYPNPFLVLDSNKDLIHVKNVNEEYFTFNLNSIYYLKILKPNILLKKFFEFNSEDFFELIKRNQKDKIKSNIFSVENKDFINFEIKDIENFLLNQSYEKNSNLNFLIDFLPSHPTYLIYEIENNLNNQKILNQIFQKFNMFPNKYFNSTLSISGFLSFIRFDFGFSKISPPKFSNLFLNFSNFNFKNLGIPNVLVNQNGNLIEYPANLIIENWIENQFLPISGPKYCHFVVFIDKSYGFTLENIQNYISQMKNLYNLLGFGNIKELSNDESYHFILSSSIIDSIDNFFKKKSLAEFQQYPIITFLISSTVFNPSFLPHSILTYIRPNSILSSSSIEISAIAFITYCRVRFFSPSPYGMYSISSREPAVLFFGFRYQPPILLNRKTDNYILHFLWDNNNELLSCVDDIGSLLHVFHCFNLNRIYDFFLDLIDFLKDINLKITFSLFSEGISNDLYEEIIQKFSNILNIISIFSLFPSPYIQFLTDFNFIDDGIVFSNIESQFIINNLKIPLSSCFIISKNQPSYQISLYFTNNNLNFNEELEFIAHQFSNLSWLSIKPTCELRTLSYPPHLSALLRKNNGITSIVSPFEFLPSTEKI